MKILSIKYDLEPSDSFTQICVFEELNKFFVGVQTSELQQSFFIFKNMIVGGLGYLANKKEINKNAVFFDSFTECEQYLTGLTEEEFLLCFRNNQIKSSPYILSELLTK